MRTNQNKTLFYDYDGFVDKFKPKLTTDDCYTPQPVYNTIIEWIKENTDITGCEIVHPFYPGGDFEYFNYPKNCVVIDNPPFSIYTKIVRYYLSRGIKFFLFAPALTTFVTKANCCFIIAKARITYENGAVVATNFVTNLFPYRVWLCGELYQRLNNLNGKQQHRDTVNFPDTVQTSAKLGAYIDDYTDIKMNKDECSAPFGNISCRKTFGGGIFIGEHLAEKLRSEKTRILKQRELNAKNNNPKNASIIYCDLTPEELKCIEQLTKKNE